jgi:hypothetical protein
MKNKRSAPTKQEFVSAVKEAFAFLGAYGFEQEPISPSERDVFVAFTSDRVRLVVEGTDWGLNTRVAFGSVGLPACFEDYDLDDLINGAADNGAARLKRGSIGTGSSQLSQVSYYATVLKERFPGLLTGDRTLFDVAERARQARVVAQQRMGSP